MTVTALHPDRTAPTEVPILDVLAARWSPRAFDPEGQVGEEVLDRALEAARWAPSAGNSQPWRFVVARRGTPTFEAVHTHLASGNQVWAERAAVLLVAVAEVEDAEGRARRWSHYDLGQSVAYLSAQAHHEGVHVHQMGGFDAAGLRATLGLDPRLEPVTVVALGRLGDPEALPDALRRREQAPRQRLDVADLVLHRDRVRADPPR